MSATFSGGARRAFPHSTRTIWMTVAMVAAVVLTPMLIGVTSSRMMDDLDMTVASLGLGTALFWSATAVSALVIAPLGDRWGWRAAGAVGLGFTALVQLGLGVCNVSALTYCVLMAAAGLGYGLVTPASNVAVVREVSPGRRGLAIGAKQAAAPLAGILAGALGPLVVFAFGWSWVFILGAAVTGCAAVLVGISPGQESTRGASGDQPRPGRSRISGLFTVAAAGALATMPVSVLSTYAVLTLEAAGFSLGAAGTVVAVASGVALATRLAGGLWIDRTGSDGMHSAAMLVAVGAVGTLAMASNAAWLVVAGTIVAFSAGWGWPGLILVGILREAGFAAAKATGRFQVGTAIGAASGPVVYVVATDIGGQSVGWLAVSILTLPAIPLIIAARKALQGNRPRQVDAAVGGIA